jgi:ubiquinone/menaquinone biosynthesis C-methylase UbiE
VEHAASATHTWDRHAARYGAQEQFELRAIDAALRLAALVPGERLVDLGTGTGLLLRRLAAAPVRPREAVGVDRAAAMLARVGALPAGWSTIHADAAAVPLPDGHADVVTCAYLLHLFGAEERRAVLAEARRLLAPRATSRLVVVTVHAAGQRPGGRLAHRTLDLLARLRPAACGGLHPLDPTADLLDAGFQPTRRVVLPRRGYPSLVIAATPALRTIDGC